MILTTCTCDTCSQVNRCIVKVANAISGEQISLADAMNIFCSFLGEVAQSVPNRRLFLEDVFNAITIYADKSTVDGVAEHVH